ncbi:tachykinin-like peptides receptor 86C [Drosophila obscura]|uniref:tachykinin-like peptides receptor 86C n=1 Tax=Drosophila obscura TaxID=7282 RepID=UPI001BB0ECAB|nr:tachykinin-like peptides receptor 86C [Drosophila obscura]
MLPQIPPYIRTTAMFFCIVIMLLGVVGNVMVPIVIVKTKDMRNSTNIFLTNLSIADLLVLLVCTPTVLVEVNTRPETWVLGHEMCKAVPFVELTVAHASVLTILAISFERYYAICEPLKAGYVCTKGRAILICVLAWGIAALFTSPILWVAEYKLAEYIDGSSVAVCLTQAITDWTIAFFLMTITVFFIMPFLTLVVLYGIIAKNLVSNQSTMLRARPTKPELSLKARKQVVLMLGAVVLSFFVCLLPFRVLTLWIILSTDQTLHEIGLVRYYSLLYFCRVMLYLNSAMNPILYNLMSTKFRRGFARLCHDAGRLLLKFLTLGRGSDGVGGTRGRSGTISTGLGTNTNTNSSNATAATSSSILSRSSNRRCSEDISRTRLKIELQLPCGSDLEAMAMLSHSGMGERMARRESDSHLMGLKNSNPTPRRHKPQISFDEEALGGPKEAPIIAISSYSVEPYGDGTDAPVCTTAADGFWTIFYFVGSITVFFFLPFGILVLLYAAIAYKLLRPNNAFHRPTSPQPQPGTGTTALSTKGNSHQQSNGMRKHRKQVIFMLVAVVSSFFVCLLPFRAFTLWVIMASAEDVERLGIAGYYNLLYFSRFMLYLNSAMNPILYNLMSSKFRGGFWRLLLTCLGQRPSHHHHRHHHHHQRQHATAGGSMRNTSRRQANDADEGATLAGGASTRPAHRTLRREATFLINSISTSSGTERTTSSSAWRSNSLSISGLGERERGILGAAIIGTTAATVTAACLQERRTSKT